MQTCLFSSGKGVDIFLLVCGREEEVGQKLHRRVAVLVIDDDIVRNFRHCVDDLLVVVK